MSHCHLPCPRLLTAIRTLCMLINSHVLGIVLCDITQALLCLASSTEHIGRFKYTAAGMESPSRVQYGNSTWQEQALLIHPSVGGHWSCKPFADYEESSRRLAAAAPKVLVSAPLHAYLHWKCCIKDCQPFQWRHPIPTDFIGRLWILSINEDTYYLFYIFNELISFYLCIW